jgi:hypothetical protein
VNRAAKQIGSDGDPLGAHDAPPGSPAFVYHRPQAAIPGAQRLRPSLARREGHQQCDHPLRCPMCAGTMVQPVRNVKARRARHDTS